MHSPLASHRHFGKLFSYCEETTLITSLVDLSACHEEIAALQACHASATWKKWVGWCNNAKEDLSRCFGREVRITLFKRSFLFCFVHHRIYLDLQSMARAKLNRDAARARRERAHHLEAQWRELDPVDGLPPTTRPPAPKDRHRLV